FGCREIGVKSQPGFFPNRVFKARRPQSRTQRLGAPILPNNGWVYGMPRVFIPKYGCFTVVVDSYGGNMRNFSLVSAKDFLYGALLTSPDFNGVVLYPA